MAPKILVHQQKIGRREDMPLSTCTDVGLGKGLSDDALALIHASGHARRAAQRSQDSDGALSLRLSMYIMDVTASDWTISDAHAADLMSGAWFQGLVADVSAVRVAYQGAPGAYSEGAAVAAYPDCTPIPCEQFEVAFQALSQWMAERAVLPIENSLGGSIHSVYDLLLRYRLSIVGEVGRP